MNPSAGPGAVNGMLSLDDLATLAAAGDVDTVVAGFTDLQGRLAGKRFDAGFFVDEVASAGTHACDYLLTADMEMTPVEGYRFASWAGGYGDVHLLPDLSSLRRAAWLDRTALVLCDVADVTTHEPVGIAPRSILRGQVEALAGAGFSAMAATELEHYLMRTGYGEAAEQGYRELQPAGWYLEDYQLLQGTRTEGFHGAARRALAASGIPVESSKGEWGVGQHEINVRYTDVLAMADRHVVFKQCLKELADRLGMSVTFMAKPWSGAAGSSCHVHLSLWDGAGNAFAGEQSFGGVLASDTFSWFLGGVLDHLGEITVLLAPTVNSYKRFVDGSWAPTRVAWSHDNRTAGLRVVGEGSSLRIECRVPGADCNPYLALAGLLAAGIDGLAKQRRAPEPFHGDLYEAADVEPLPASLAEATERFCGSDFVRASFGEDAVEHYGHFFRTEAAAYAAAVTDWERQRYFERI
jgi:glutamine synthetase